MKGEHIRHWSDIHSHPSGSLIHKYSVRQGFFISYPRKLYRWEDENLETRVLVIKFLRDFGIASLCPSWHASFIDYRTLGDVITWCYTASRPVGGREGGWVRVRARGQITGSR